MNLKSFYDFQPINETVAGAKSLLLKLASDRKRKKMNLSTGEKISFTPEEEKKILNNPDYIQVRDYFLNVVKKPGLVYPFTYFRIVEGLPFEGGVRSVVGLNEKLEEVSPMLKTFSLPLGSPDGYVKYKILDPSGDVKPAYVLLDEDIDRILSQKIVKEFVDRFVGPIRREYIKSVQEAPQDKERAELLNRLYHAVHDLKKLKPIADKINKKTGLPETAENQLIADASRYKNADFSFNVDSYTAFKEFVNETEAKVVSWGLGIDEFLTELKEIEPSIKIAYYNSKSKVLVTSARSSKAMKVICKISNSTYCIRDPKVFLNYTKGKIQINFNLLGTPKTSPTFLTGITISPDGKITHSGSTNNVTVHRHGETYIEFIERYFNIDEDEKKDIIKTIERISKPELAIKNIVLSIEEKSGFEVVDKKILIRFLTTFGVQRSIDQGDYTKEEIEEFLSVVISIVKDDNSISYNDVTESFLNPVNGGFWSKLDIDVFKILTDDKYNKQQIVEIMDLTKSAIEILKESISYWTDEKDIRIGNALINNHPDVMKYTEDILL